MNETLSEKKHFLTAREAANYLRISLSTLYRLERDGRLQSLRTPGGHRRYTTAMLEECLNKREKSSGEVLLGQN